MAPKGRPKLNAPRPAPEPKTKKVRKRSKSGKIAQREETEEEECKPSTSAPVADDDPLPTREEYLAMLLPRRPSLATTNSSTQPKSNIKPPKKHEPPPDYRDERPYPSDDSVVDSDAFRIWQLLHARTPMDEAHNVDNVSFISDEIVDIRRFRRDVSAVMALFYPLHGYNAIDGKRAMFDRLLKRAPFAELGAERSASAAAVGNNDQAERLALKIYGAKKAFEVHFHSYFHVISCYPADWCTKR